MPLDATRYNLLTVGEVAAIAVLRKGGSVAPMAACCGSATIVARMKMGF
jgi:hypothetical protein